MNKKKKKKKKKEEEEEEEVVVIQLEDFDEDIDVAQVSMIPMHRDDNDQDEEDAEIIDLRVCQWRWCRYELGRNDAAYGHQLFFTILNQIWTRNKKEILTPQHW